MRHSLVLAVALATAATAHAEDTPTVTPAPAAPADPQRTLRLVALGVGIATFITTEHILQGTLAPDECRWCGGNRFDDAARSTLRWNDPALAAGLSDLGYYAAPLGAGLYLVAAAPGDRRFGTLFDDAIVVIEAVTYSQVMNNVVKSIAGRQRPYARFAVAPIEPDAEANLSFFSGHASWTAAIATSTCSVAIRRDYRFAHSICGGLGAIAIATSYLRVAADRHYALDAITGTLYGAAAGIVVPRLTGSLPARVVPMRDGVAIVGAF